MLAGRGHDALVAGADRFDRVAVRLEAGAERSTDLRLVVDHQHLHPAGSSIGSPGTRAPPGGPAPLTPHPPPRRAAPVSSTQILPPCAITTARAIDSPRPLPGRSGSSRPR